MKIVRSGSKLPEMIKKMSMNERFPVSLHTVQGEVREIVQMFGESTCEETNGFTRRFYEIFNIPICKLIVQIDDGNVILNHCEPALKNEVKWDIVRNKVHELRKS